MVSDNVYTTSLLQMALRETSLASAEASSAPKSTCVSSNYDQIEVLLICRSEDLQPAAVQLLEAVVEYDCALTCGIDLLVFPQIRGFDSD